MSVGRFCVLADRAVVSFPRLGAPGQSTGVNLWGKFGRLSRRFYHPWSFREPPARPHSQGTSCGAPGTRLRASSQFLGPRAGAPLLGRSPRQIRGPSARTGFCRPRVLISHPLAFPWSRRPAVASRPLSSPNQQINTTFYEKKTTSAK